MISRYPKRRRLQTVASARLMFRCNVSGDCRLQVHMRFSSVLISFHVVKVLEHVLTEFMTQAGGGTSR